MLLLSVILSQVRSALHFFFSPFPAHLIRNAFFFWNTPVDFSMYRYMKTVSTPMKGQQTIHESKCALLVTDELVEAKNGTRRAKVDVPQLHTAGLRRDFSSPVSAVGQCGQL